MPSTVVLDIETVAPEEHRDALVAMAGARDPDAYGALCPPLARVVCVCLAKLDEHDEVVSEKALYDDPIDSFLRPEAQIPGAEAMGGEAALLARLAVLIQNASRIVTFNGSSFDIPTLLMRSIAHGVPSPTLLRAHREHRFKPDLNYDVKEQFSNYGRFRDGSLRAFCLGFGLPDPKASGCGLNVADLVRMGDVDGLVTYCKGDVRATAALYRRWRQFTGETMVHPSATATPQMELPA